jgi:hypothetical protein
MLISLLLYLLLALRLNTKDIIPGVMQQIDEERTVRGRKVRFTYLAEAEVLIIAIPT